MAITVALLRQAGAPPELIARVCELEEQERLEHRRTQVREAVRRHRARNQCNDYRDYQDYKTGHVYKEVSKKEEVSKHTPRQARKCALPPNYHPDLAWAVQEASWTSERAAAEAQRFKDHAIANARLQADWPAAWRNWVRSPYQAKGNGHGNGQSLGRSSYAERKLARKERVTAAGDALTDFAYGGGEADQGAAGGLPDPGPARPGRLFR